MAVLPNPSDTYRRIDFDARVAGADQHQLVALCFEQLVSALGSAIYAADNMDNRQKSASLTRALSALTALELGVDPDQAAGPALLRLYASARRAVLDSVPAFDRKTVHAVRQDFIEIAQALFPGHAPAPRMLNNGG